MTPAIPVDWWSRAHARRRLADSAPSLRGLLDVAPDDLELRERLGHLFLAAGSAQRAGEIFRDILHRNPQDADAYAGLGEAEFARGNYQAAHQDFQIAENLRPSDMGIRGRLGLTSEVLALDPMRRGLGPEEQYRRSVKMLELASAAVARCSGEEVQKAATSRVGSAGLSAALESNLNLAEQLWKIRMQECKQGPSAEEEALRLVLARIAQ